MNRHVLNRESEDNEQHWFWIGLNRRNPMDNGSWKWSDGQAVSSRVVRGYGLGVRGSGLGFGFPSWSLMCSR